MKFILLISLISMVYFAWLTVSRAGLPYNEEGRYFDETDTTVYHAQAFEIYFGLMVLFSIVFIISIVIFLKQNRHLR